MDRCDNSTATTTIGPNSSQLLRIKDLKSGELFLVDSGAEVSIVKPTAAEKSLPPNSLSLTSVSGSPIATFGNRIMTLSFGSQQTFRWIFVIADVKHNIVGVDFLKHYALVVNFGRSTLNNCISNSSWNLIKMVGNVEVPKPYLVTNEYLKMLQGFPELTRPPNKNKLVKHDVVHEIDTTGYPCHARARPLSPEKIDIVKHEVDYLLDAGIIRRSNSAYSSPLHLVPKKDTGKFRLVGDYRALNLHTVPDRYPTPSVQSLLHRLSGSTIFSKIDLIKAYHQIPMSPSARKKTAIICPLGLFEYDYMPFGLKNASATFQRFIDQVCQGLPNVMAYVDDIIIFSKTEEEHKSQVFKLFQRLDSFGVGINISKCEFGTNEIAFLGHLVSSHGIKPLPDKIEAIQKYPLPTTVKQLRRYLGMIQYYNRFVPQAAKYLAPLNEFMRGGVKNSQKLQWNTVSENAFLQSKTLLVDSTSLVFPDSHSPMAVFVDASDIAVGAVLQIKKEGVWCPVAFFSRRLDQTQCKYATFDRELLAAYSATKHFRHFLECKEFALFTDHKPLVRAFQSAHSQESGRRARQMSYITEYTTDIRYISGSENFTADALSRITINNVEYFRDNIDYEAMAVAQKTDLDTLELVSLPDKTSLRLEQFQVPSKPSVLIWCDTSTGVIRPFVPEQFRKTIFDKIHQLSHPGIKASINLIKHRFVWSGMKKDITSWVRTCLTCQSNKIQRHNFSEFKAYPLPNARFQEINLDIVGPLPQSNGYSYMLTVIDRYTRYLSAIPMKDATTLSVIEAFMHGYISHFGVPNVLTTDRAAQFESALFSQLLQFLGCQRNRTTSYHPQSNGLVENAHRRLKAALRMQINPQRWYHNLPLVLLSLRNTPKAEIECSPAELVFGQTVKLPGQFTITSENAYVHQSDLIESLSEHFATIHPSPTRIKSHLTHYVDENLKRCTHVWLRNDFIKGSLHPRYSGPYEVVKRDGKVFTIIIKDSLKTVSVDRLKAAYLPTDVGRVQTTPRVSDMSDPADTVMDHTRPSNLRTRSGRAVRRPSRFQDYIMHAQASDE